MTAGMTGMYPSPPVLRPLDAGRAAGRALFCIPQAADACWADVEMDNGDMRACGITEATTLGLCADHLVELFGIEA